MVDMKPAFLAELREPTLFAAILGSPSRRAPERRLSASCLSSTSCNRSCTAGGGLKQATSSGDSMAMNGGAPLTRADLVSPVGGLPAMLGSLIVPRMASGLTLAIHQDAILVQQFSFDRGLEDAPPCIVTASSPSFAPASIAAGC